MSLADDVLKCLQGEAPQTFTEIFDALDFDGTRGELRTCLKSLAQQARLIKGACADGFTRYGLTQFERVPIASTPAKSPASIASHAQPTDVAGAAASTLETSTPLPGALSSLPARLLARIESVAVDIEDLTGEAIDAGLGAGALKSLVAAGGAIRRALLPFNLRS